MKKYSLSIHFKGTASIITFLISSNYETRKEVLKQFYKSNIEAKMNYSWLTFESDTGICCIDSNSVLVMEVKDCIQEDANADS